jgi:RNA-directed DNA polymerase
LSPLLADILLDDLDKELEKRGHRFVRYADDFIIPVKSRSAGERVMRSVQRFLERKLKLQVNREKSQVRKTDQTQFLGFVVKGTKIRWSDDAFREFKRRVKRLILWPGQCQQGTCVCQRTLGSPHWKAI